MTADGRAMIQAILLNVLDSCTLDISVGVTRSLRELVTAHRNIS
ncbi:hypothetical protein CI610_03396 [invertebrate metagenome]|uniref:Uncharacterized protein n=1 Tax=invertebrate metagenome TaxID=1711999 RepID=A0A2H9T3B2_9ZZZZ